MPAAPSLRPRHPLRPPQRRDRRPRRPRQDHARRRDAPPDRHVPGERGRRRPRHGLERPRAREGHHDPRQADDRRPRRRPPEHRRHAGPRRLRRRGRAEPAHGRLACCCSSTPRRARCRRRATSSRRRWPAACRSSSRSTRSTARDARAAEVLDEVYELFIDLGADDHQIDFPVVYTNAKAGHRDAVPRRARARTCSPLLDLLVEVTPPPAYEPGHPLQLLVTNLIGERLRRADGGRADLERHDPDGPADHRRPRGGRRHGGTRRAGPDGHAAPGP